jgi:transcriptional regulator with XRE-family HTH domain
MEIDELKRLFGLRVHSLRRRAGLTQEQLADAIGKSLDTVSNVERGISSTRIETMDKIATVLGVSLAELFELDAPVSRDKEARKAVERLVRVVEGESAETVEAVAKMAELALNLSPKVKGSA